eukprot:Rhum_TRINITY_DN14379_c22_g1::Rhum_TRINITY_DN14379_c22_g1_i1::g.86501::m.86501/K18752/TNPO1, IPO2, KPNB2; transportin-1
MSSFVPVEEHYLQVVELLKKALDPTPGVVQEAWQQFELYSNRADFNCYLAHIMATKTQPIPIRQNATLVLKNGVHANFEKGVRPHIVFILGNLMQCVGDAERPIREAVASCISVLAVQGVPGSDESMHLLRLLTETLASPDLPTAQGAVQALHNICEDCIEGLFAAGAKQATALVPALLGASQHSDALVREKALWSLVNLCTGAHEIQLQSLELYDKEIPFPKVITDNIQNILSAAMRLSMEGVRTQAAVCRALQFCAETHLDQLDPHMANVFEYLLMIQKKHAHQGDESLALEASDFWIAIVGDEKRVHSPLFLQKMPELVEMLLQSLVYSESELSMIAAVDDDVGTKDSSQNVRPGFHGKSKPAGGGGGGDGESDEEDEDDEEEGDDDEDDNNWNVRRSSACTLEALATVFGAKGDQGFMTLALPLLLARLEPSNDWRIRESAVLGLGAICCVKQAVLPSAPQLIRGLTTQTATDAHPLIRATTAWALRRIAEHVQEDNGALEQILSPLVVLLADKSKRVVGRTASALSGSVRAKGILDFMQLNAQHTAAILAALQRAVSVCDSVNLQGLFNTYVSVAENLGNNLNSPEFVQVLMPPLVQKWEMFPDNDPRLQGLMECLGAQATAIGPGFQPWAKGSFERATSVLDAATTYRVQNNFDSDAEFIIAALDLMGGLLDGLESSIEPLFAASLPRLAELLLQSVNDPHPKVQQSALAMLGDSAKWCWPHVSSFAPQFLPGLLELSKNFGEPHLCMNALYALSEIIVKAGPAYNAAPQTAEVLVCLLNTSGLPGPIGENASVCMGRLSLSHYEGLAPRLGEFIKPFCSFVRTVDDPKEKEHAFLGLAQLIKLNPNACFESFAYVCEAVSRYDPAAIPDQVRQQYGTLLNGFKQHIGAGWDSYMKKFPAKLREKLSVLFSIQ